MNPVNFKEANVDLQKPDGMTDEECGSLPVFRDGKQCVSCWCPSWRERLSVLFYGRIWLSVMSGRTQPPVMIWSTRKGFKYLRPGLYVKFKVGDVRISAGIMAHSFQADQRWVFLLRVGRYRFGFRTRGDAADWQSIWHDAGFHWPWKYRGVAGRD